MHLDDDIEDVAPLRLHEGAGGGQLPAFGEKTKSEEFQVQRIEHGADVYPIGILRRERGKVETPDESEDNVFEALLPLGFRLRKLRVEPGLARLPQVIHTIARCRCEQIRFTDQVRVDNW